MAGSDENNPGVIGPGNFRGTYTTSRPLKDSTQSENLEGLRAEAVKNTTGIGHSRRALSNVDWNVIGAPYPSAIAKKSLADHRKHAIRAKNPHRPITRHFAAQMSRKQDRNVIGAPYPSAIAKKSLEDQRKHAIRTKNPPIPVPRPITRHFAAQMSSKQQLKPEEKIIDEDDDKMNDDFSALMYVQQTESMLEEIDRMDEVEMKDVDDEPIMDIDSDDKRNALAVVEYVEDLYKFYKKVECCNCVPPDYMDHQPDINDSMRGILIDWLIEVHYKFELMDETLYLMVNIIDRFLAVRQIGRKKLQLVGVTAMLLACKYEEVLVPIVEDLIIISDKAYSRKEVLDMEKLMVNALQFHMSVPTPYVFMRRFLKAMQSDEKLELLAFFIIELCLVEYQMVEFPPSLLAAAAVYTARCTITRTQEWSKTCELHTSYREEQLLECARLMVSFHQKAGTGKLTGVQRKYNNTSKFGYAARTEPADFILNAIF